MKKTKRKTGLLGLAEEIENKWAILYVNEGVVRSDGADPGPDYRSVKSMHLAARLKRIYKTEVEPLKKALEKALDMSSFFGCPGSRCEHYRKCQQRKEADKKAKRPLADVTTHCFRHEAWRKLIGKPDQEDGLK